jgi:plasmid stabilization system protein ParE
VRFKVVWRQSALEDLAAIWLEEQDRERVTRAANSVERMLSDDPRSKGDEFYGDLLLTTDRLEVTYAVEDEDRLVRVLQVRWHFTRA